MTLRATIGRMARPRVTLWAAVVVGIGFVATEAILLNVRIRDYDEGVYWQSIRALVHGEPLFSSVFASQPPAFYYALLPFWVTGHALASLRVSVLILGVIGLAATYVVAGLLAGRVAGLIAVVLAATSPLYLHQSGIVQADGPAVAVSMVAVAFALLSARRQGWRRDALAAATGVTLALAIGLKLLAAVTLIPIVIALPLASRGRGRVAVMAAAGAVVGLLVVMVPAIAAPRAAFDQLVLMHLRAGNATPGNLGENVRLILLHRELPLELVAGLGALVALYRRDSAIIMPLAWLAISVLAVLFYHPLFPHHLVMLSLVLALVAAVGITPSPTLPTRGREMSAGRGGRKELPAFVSLALVLATAGAGVVVAVRDVELALVPDRHNAEMIASIESIGRPGDFWISDNPFAVAAAGRNIPGPLVDTSGQRISAGLLTSADLEAARVRYHVQWVLEDSFRLPGVPGYPDWLNHHFHPMEQLGGGAVVYQVNAAP